jgi:hypothetical protein
MRRQKGSRKEPDLPWPAARPICRSASHHIRPEIRNPSHRENDHSGFGLRAALRIEATPQITGSSRGTVQQVEIDQHSRELAMRRMSDNFRLSDTVGGPVIAASLWWCRSR